MALRFAYRAPDGGVCIVIAAPKEDLAPIFGGELSDEDYRAHVLERSIPPEAVDVIELPDDWTAPEEDRTLRNAWALEKGRVTIDMPKAYEVWKDKMRETRAPLLAELDVEITRALKDPVKQDEIEAKRQALRDVTSDPAIESAKTPEELKAVWPEVLSESRPQNLSGELGGP